jgi:hypothetical protein
MPVVNIVDGLAVMHDGRKLDVDILLEMLKRAQPIVEWDALMMADISRHAPLKPEDQAKHDSTEYPSEIWLRDYKRYVPEAFAA